MPVPHIIYIVHIEYLPTYFMSARGLIFNQISGDSWSGGCSVLYLFPFPPVASAPTNLTAVQEGLTGIRVFWTPPTPLGNTTGYRIYYSGGSSGSVNFSDGSTDNYLVGSLQNGANYTIRIVGTSIHLFSKEVESSSSITLSELFQLVSVHRMCGYSHSLHT